MEERMIDDEYGRGIRLKKTKDGFVDVTDELAEGKVEEGEETTEELSFEFPIMEGEDDEDLVGLSPEEALKLRQQKEEEAKIRRAKYDEECAIGQKLLDDNDFAGAEAQFEKALALDKVATEASVGYWRAKTENFANPDVLVGEYADASIESLEYDLGVEAVEIIKKEHKEALQARYAQLQEEEKPLAERVATSMSLRREVISDRLKRRAIFFACIALPLAAALVLTVVFTLRLFTPNGEKYMIYTIVSGACAFLFFLAFIFATNKLVNVLRMKKANEQVGGTEDGDKLVEIRDYMTIYENLLDLVQNG